MTKNQYILALILLTTAGIIGGAISSWIISPREVEAQTRSETNRLPSMKIVRTQRLEIVDEDGEVWAMLGFRYIAPRTPILTLYTSGKNNVNGRAEIMLVDKNDQMGESNKSSITLSVFSGGGARLEVCDKEGKVIWKTPQ